MRIPKNDHSVKGNQGDSTVVGVVEVREEESEAMALCAAWRAAGGEGTMSRIAYCRAAAAQALCAAWSANLLANTMTTTAIVPGVKLPTAAKRAREN